MFPELTRDEVFMIATERLWLRWPRQTDAERLAAIGGAADVAKMTATWPIGCTAAYARERIAQMRARNMAGTAMTMVIAERAQWGRAIGLIGIAVDGSEGRLGYHLDPAQWGRGYATEALDGLIGMTRLLTRIDTLKAGVIPGNTASMNVLTKNGFVRAGTSLFHSPIKGPIEVVDFMRPLRRRLPDRAGPPARHVTEALRATA